MPVAEAIEIRGVRAHRGERTQGAIEIGETADGPVRIPIVVVNGDEDGPVLCLTAGVHATEYPPIDAVMRTIAGLQPRRLKGAVIAVPVANVPMYESRTPFVSPIDGLNLNKVAPGNRGGTISEVLAHVLLDEVIARSQVYIDLHGGDMGEILLPFVACALTGDAELDRRREALARVYSPDVIALSRDGTSVPPFAGAVSHAAAQRGIVALFAEAGGNGTLEEDDVRVHVQGIENVMRYLGMIEGEPRVAASHTKGIGRVVTRATRAGLLRLKVGIGDRIVEGQEVAEVCNLFGEVVEVVRAAASGVAGLIWAHKVVNTGDPVVRCWLTEPAGPFPTTDRFAGTRPAQRAG